MLRKFSRGLLTITSREAASHEPRERDLSQLLIHRAGKKVMEIRWDKATSPVIGSNYFTTSIADRRAYGPPQRVEAAGLHDPVSRISRIFAILVTNRRKSPLAGNCPAFLRALTTSHSRLHTTPTL